MQTIVVTGCAGFIGYHLSRRLLAQGFQVAGIDNLNAYYDTGLKKNRLEQLQATKGFQFSKVDLADRAAVEEVFARQLGETVVHLAAQAGVRYSVENPYTCLNSNVTAFMNLLEGCRRQPPRHLVFASSSSVYGANRKRPFAVTDSVDHPVSLYAATKKANELMAHTYSHLFGIPTTGLRFFTVYGPWGRPDMAYYSFSEAILRGDAITVFNEGRMRRDFTYIDDIIEVLLRVVEHPPIPDPTFTDFHLDPSRSDAPYRIYNVGNNRPEELMDMIHILEDLLGKEAVVEMAPMQAGDVIETFADIEALQRDFSYTPSTPLKAGLSRFVEWFLQYKSNEGMART